MEIGLSGSLGTLGGEQPGQDVLPCGQQVGGEHLDGVDSV